MFTMLETYQKTNLMLLYYQFNCELSFNSQLVTSFGKFCLKYFVSDVMFDIMFDVMFDVMSDITSDVITDVMSDLTCALTLVSLPGSQLLHNKMLIPLGYIRLRIKIMVVPTL